MTKEEVIFELYHSNRAVNMELDKRYNSYLIGKAAAYDEAIQLVKEIQEPERKWIPVSERLPEKDGYYFVTKRFMDGRIKTDIEHFWTGADWWKSEFHFAGIGLWEVLAWQPLPEPYKAGERE